MEISNRTKIQDALIVDSEQIKILNGEEQNTDIIPFGFSLSLDQESVTKRNRY